MPVHEVAGVADVADTAYRDIVDLERYPIHQLDTERGRELVQACRRGLADDGACTLDGFIRPDAVAQMIAVADSLDDEAFASERTHTVYFEPVDNSVPMSHPRARLVRSAKHGIAYDQIPVDAPLRVLYESDALTHFIARVLDKPKLYRSADPLDALQITKFFPGEELGWHFDRSEFSITVMYRPAAEGGQFEYVPRLRDEHDACHDEVQKVLEGDRTRVRILDGLPGTLAFFRGEHALHRVTPVEGDHARINSVLTYGVRPDMRLNDLTSKLFYGRTSSSGR